jgi:hypothetical protein
MANTSNTFEITFQGVEYVVDVQVWKNKTTVYIEYANIDDDVGEIGLLKLTKYLIGEGFINCDDE